MGVLYSLPCKKCGNYGWMTKQNPICKECDDAEHAISEKHAHNKNEHAKDGGKK